MSTKAQQSLKEMLCSHNAKVDALLADAMTVLLAGNYTPSEFLLSLSGALAQAFPTSSKLLHQASSCFSAGATIPVATYLIKNARLEHRPPCNTYLVAGDLYSLSGGVPERIEDLSKIPLDLTRSLEDQAHVIGLNHITIGVNICLHVRESLFEINPDVFERHLEVIAYE